VPGAYTLESEDASDQQLTRHLQAIPPTEIPALLQQVLSEARSKTEKQLRNTGYAAWLIKHDPLIRSLETYLRVAGISTEFYPAELLRLRLEGEL